MGCKMKHMVITRNGYKMTDMYIFEIYIMKQSQLGLAPNKREDSKGKSSCMEKE